MENGEDNSDHDSSGISSLESGDDGILKKQVEHAAEGSNGSPVAKSVASNADTAGEAQCNGVDSPGRFRRSTRETKKPARLSDIKFEEETANTKKTTQLQRDVRRYNHELCLLTCNFQRNPHLVDKNMLFLRQAIELIKHGDPYTDAHEKIVLKALERARVFWEKAAEDHADVDFELV
ncbi:hypothetical protein B0O99DRAFT_686589 [Bisporella sp. PMI_857]|nr:hypothetical protein B0O99DRAFT_686589 [Bisporella sp. PMI_857]